MSEWYILADINVYFSIGKSFENDLYKVTESKQRSILDSGQVSVCL